MFQPVNLSYSQYFKSELLLYQGLQLRAEDSFSELHDALYGTE